MHLKGVGLTSLIALPKHIEFRFVEKHEKQQKSKPKTVQDYASSVEVSEEAKEKNAKSGKADPQTIAKSLGAENFGQLVKALREAGQVLTVSYISDLVHGNETAIAKAKDAMKTLSEKSYASVPKEDPTNTL